MHQFSNFDFQNNYTPRTTSCKGGGYTGFSLSVCLSVPLSVDAISLTQLLLQFSKHFLQTFTDEQPQHVDVHEGRNLRCDDFCQNYGPLFLHLLYNI